MNSTLLLHLSHHHLISLFKHQITHSRFRSSKHFCTLSNVQEPIIHVAFYTENDLIKTNNPYFQQWAKELKNYKFYDKFKEPSHYDGTTNAQIGLMLQQKNPIPYEKIAQHFEAALKSNELL